MRARNAISIMIVIVTTFVNCLSTVHAQSVVDIDLPNNPIPVAMTTLQVTSVFDTSTITVPASNTLTTTITNIGPVPAQRVQLEQDLPPGVLITPIANQTPDDLVNLQPGDSIQRQWNVIFTAALSTDRYTIEQFISAANADTTESDASIDATNGTVLGATDSVWQIPA